ncbi:MAG: BTAD domain-containing putative transcriptional regulator [Microthrixaceae bacterium]
MDPVARPVLLAFGGVAAVGPDGPVDIGGPKQRAVLALLMLEPGTVVSLDRIVERIWGDTPPTRAEASVRAYVSNLRKALASTGLDSDSGIEFRERGYVLLVPPVAVDLHRFESLIDEAMERRRVGDLNGARSLLDQSLELHAGPPLGETANDLDLVDVVSRYEERRSAAVEVLTDVRLELGEHAQIPATLASEIARQPYREGLRAQLALALYRAGRPVEALRAIDDARRRLLEDVGVDPGHELRDLEGAILAHDERLAWVAPMTSSAPDPALPDAELDDEPNPQPGAELDAEQNAAGLDVNSDSVSELRFGREAERDAVFGLLDRLPQRGGVLVVSGEAGIGKSTLLGALRSECAVRRIAMGWDRCPESAAGASYRSWRSATAALLADAAPLSDRALLADAAPLSDEQTIDQTFSPEAAGELFSAHLRELDRLRSRSEPAVVVIDDLQWADDATLALLGFLAPELARLRIVLAVGVRRTRSSELAPAVRNCLIELGRTSDPILLTLEGLGSGAIGQWIESVSATEPSTDLMDYVATTTRGNPFYVRELLRLFAAEGRLDGQFERPSTVVPSAVQDVVRRRTSRLPGDTQALLSVAAVIGCQFDLDVLAGVVDSTVAEVLARLEPALDEGLVEVEAAMAGRFTFSHALVSSTLVAELNAARRAAHHARITQVIEQLRAADIGPWVEDLAYHASEGVIAGTAAKAVSYSLRAADAAQAVQAHADVAAHLERAVAASVIVDGFKSEQRRRLLVRMGIAQRDSGNPAGRETLVEAARLAEAQGDIHAVAEIFAGLDPESLWAGYDWGLSDAQVVALIERTLARPGLDSGDRTLLTVALAGELTYLDNERSNSMFAEAWAMAEPLDDAVLSARILLQWFWSVSGPSGHAARAQIGDRLVALAEGGELPRRLRPLAHLARVSSALEVGDGELARESVAKARALAHPVRTPTAWAHLQFAEAGLALADDDLERARAHASALRSALLRVRRYTADTSPASILAVAAAESGDTDAALGHLAVLLESPYAAPIGWLEAWVLAEGGRIEAIPAALARFDGPLPDDWLAPALTTAGIHAAAVVGDTRFLRRNLPSIEPLADRFAFVGEGGPCLGPTSLAIAAAWSTLGDPTSARSHAQQAVAICERMGAPRWLARSKRLIDSIAVD